MMDYKAFFLERLEKVDAYLNSTSVANRSYALGRVLEVEAIAFSLRNSAVITTFEFDAVDSFAEVIRKRHKLAVGR